MVFRSIFWWLRSANSNNTNNFNNVNNNGNWNNNNANNTNGVSPDFCKESRTGKIKSFWNNTLTAFIKKGSVYPWDRYLSWSESVMIMLGRFLHGLGFEIVYLNYMGIDYVTRKILILLYTDYETLCLFCYGVNYE